MPEASLIEGVPVSLYEVIAYLKRNGRRVERDTNGYDVEQYFNEMLSSVTSSHIKLHYDTETNSLILGYRIGTDIRLSLLVVILWDCSALQVISKKKVFLPLLVTVLVPPLRAMM